LIELICLISSSILARDTSSCWSLQPCTSVSLWILRLCYSFSAFRVWFSDSSFS